DAQEAGVVLCLENVWNKFLLSPIEFRDYVDWFQSDFLQSYFDVGNIVLYGYPQHWIRSLGPTLRKVHVKGFDADKRQFCWLLEGTIDWAAVMAALREVGYDGYVTAELPGYPGFAEQMVRDTSSHLDRILEL
ncbi:MAG: sugar phosphate isomerase/epimerase family protein, partial [Armatimonadota bacterium]